MFHRIFLWVCCASADCCQVCRALTLKEVRSHPPSLRFVNGCSVQSWVGNTCAVVDLYPVFYNE